DCDSDFQIVVLCGKNQKLKARLEKLKAGSKKALHAIGYTTSMQTYLAAADIMIGKSGGLTSSECLAAGLPMLIVNPIPGQEEGNANQLLEHGAALSCTTRAITYKLDKILTSEDNLEKMRKAAQSLGRPNSANVISKEFVTGAKEYQTTAKSYLERVLTR
ncbi:MAG: glycosyltransferase, partial [Leptolyngbya sp.]|nr:glycosyltransferase [Candidatus Melainabacteria bacterium]